MNWSIDYTEPAARCTVDLPLSKSLAARALMLGGRIDPTPGLCDDLRMLVDALRHCNGAVYIGSSGTALRFLTARFACMPGADVVIDGTAQLRTRPVGTLVATLRSLGADISYLGRECFAPLHIVGRRLNGGRVLIDASVSSQYVSALLLAAPFMTNGIEVVVSSLTSEPYIDMTCEVCRDFGLDAGRHKNVFYARRRQRDVIISPGYTIEADWSAASYFLEISALTGSEIVLRGLGSPLTSIQGDAHSVGLFEKLGVGVSACGVIEVKKCGTSEDAIDIDMRNMPDVVPAFAVGCALCGVPFRLSGLDTLRVKESDRISALRNGLRHLGFSVVSGHDWLAWNGAYCPEEKTMVIDAYDDHRMAMAFAPAACLGNMTIVGAECVSKSFPDFATQIGRCGFNVTYI